MVEIETTYQIETTHINMRGKEWTEYDNKQWVSLEEYEELETSVSKWRDKYLETTRSNE